MAYLSNVPLWSQARQGETLYLYLLVSPHVVLGTQMKESKNA